MFSSNVLVFSLYNGSLQEVCIQITDRPRSEFGVTRQSFKLSAEACVPSLALDDSITFEEQMICKNMKEYEIIKSHSVSISSTSLF